MRIEFKIPARGLFGYRGEFLTDTRGEGILNTVFDGYEPYKGDIEKRTVGSLIAFETGDAVTYGLYNGTGARDLVHWGGHACLYGHGSRIVAEKRGPGGECLQEETRVERACFRKR